MVFLVRSRSYSVITGVAHPGDSGIIMWLGPSVLLPLLFPGGDLPLRPGRPITANNFEKRYLESNGLSRGWRFPAGCPCAPRFFLGGSSDPSKIINPFSTYSLRARLWFGPSGHRTTSPNCEGASKPPRITCAQHWYQRESNSEQGLRDARLRYQRSSSDAML